MKRIFLILLLLALPLQMSWAAASAYCLHEEGKSAQHLGHHSHEHKAKAEKTPAKKDNGQPHSDCNFCHGIGQATFPITAHLAVFSPGSSPVEASPIFYASHIPDGPKRPDWRSVA
ncbi:hypothetical protein [Janthinobacterium fluminis]|uniref:Cobalt-zinc-cadmium resistance protein CzcI n=1 Tax=Janthinobacterium fluminis TaxID=2987524 RepID=A0ABT5K6W1_9BURK|nr:hypothetical protein [Janthinobacterium fluminis]MDC8760742.1 hypothetical protein [Janthinobacterium fluminis]